MTTLKDHQATMVDLLANGSPLSPSGSRLAHALHDVLAYLNNTNAAPVAHTERRIDATTPGLNDALLAADVQAVKSKQQSLESLLKQRDNIIRQLKGRVADLKSDYANLEAQLNAVLAIQKEPEQAGCRKDDTQLPDDGWIKWGGGECPVDGEISVDVRFRSGSVVSDFTAKSWDWSPGRHPGDIIAYRIVGGAE